MWLAGTDRSFTSTEPDRTCRGTEDITDSPFRYADFDGDGDGDGLTSSSYGSAYALFPCLGDGAGTFSSGTPFPYEASLTIGGFEDADGDGDHDLAALDHHERLHLVEGGASGLTLRSTTHLPVGTPSLALWADVDGDGVDEVLAGDSHEELVWLLDDFGQADREDWFAAAAGTNTDLLAVDLDGDGLRELISAARYHLAAWQQVAPRELELLTSTELDTQSVSLVPFGFDVDLDGDEEVLIGIGSALYVYDLVGGAFVSTGTVRGLELDLPYGTGVPSEKLLHRGDVDGDGDHELVLELASGESYDALIVAGVGESGYPTAQEDWLEAAGAPVARSSVVHDLDGDGSDEIVLLEADAVLVIGWDGSEPVSLARSAVAWGDTGERVGTIARDEDGDGNPDLIIAAGEALQVLLGDGAGGFTAGTSQALPEPHARGQWHPVVLRDGGPIEAWASYDAGDGWDHVEVARDDGDGGLEALGTLRLFDVHETRLADVDGDGVQDLLVGDDTSAWIRWGGLDPFERPTCDP